MRSSPVLIACLAAAAIACERAGEPPAAQADRAAASRPAPGKVSSHLDPPPPEPLVTSYDPPPPEAAPYLDVVHRYYARWDPARETPREFEARYRKGPEFAAYDARVDDKIDRRDEWRDALAEIRAELPDYIVYASDYPGGPGNWAYIFDKDRPDPLVELEVGTSCLVPHYLMTQVVSARGADPVRQVDFDPELADVAAVVERVFGERFGLTRFPPELTRVPVPDIATRSVGLEQANLADALFGLDQHEASYR